MSNVANLTVEILKQIRDEVRSTNERLSETNQRLDETRVELRGELARTNERLTKTNAQLEELKGITLRVAQSNQAILELQQDDSERIRSLERRMNAVEKHLGF